MDPGPRRAIAVAGPAPAPTAPNDLQEPGHAYTCGDSRSHLFAADLRQKKIERRINKMVKRIAIGFNSFLFFTISGAEELKILKVS